MAKDQKGAVGIQQLTRVFEQPPDAISFYSDLAQVSNTGKEVLLQFYETIPGPPGPDGITQVTARLRATVIISLAHAANLEHLLSVQREQPGGVQEAQALPAKGENP